MDVGMVTVVRFGGGWDWTDQGDEDETVGCPERMYLTPGGPVQSQDECGKSRRTTTDYVDSFTVGSR